MSWHRAIVIAAMLAACGRDEPAPAPAPPTIVAARRVTTADDSNVTAADYVGPAACADCHPAESARWSASLHAAMNARADAPGAVIGDFSGVTLHYAGGDVQFARDHGAYVMIATRGATTTRYRVTRTIGRRGLQEYVGVVAGDASASASAADEVRLPFAWWPRRAGWYPQPYFDPWLTDEAAFDAFAPVREPWAARCPWCHSTYPFALRIARSAGPLQLGLGLEQFFAPRVASGTAASPRLPVEQQVTTGISCESCHLGGRAHVAGLPIHLVPRGASIVRAATAPLPPATTAFADERRDARVVDATCAQCHSGPSPRFPDGGATRNSSEAIDLAAAPCTGIRCTDCHDPHRGPPGAGPEMERASGRWQAAIDDTRRAIAACIGCHREFAAPAVIASHAGPGHTSASCLDCHMPAQVLGLDHFVRTHRISSPTAPAMLSAGAPNACNLCHLDRSLSWTLDALATGWSVRLAPAASWARAYVGGLDAPVGEGWLANSSPAIRLIATAAYARAPALGRAIVPRLLDALADPLPYVRTWTLFAVEDLLGHRVRDADFDPRAPAATRAAQLARLRASVEHP